MASGQTDRCTSASYRHGTGSANNYEPLPVVLGANLCILRRARHGEAMSEVLDFSCAYAAI